MESRLSRGQLLEIIHELKTENQKLKEKNWRLSEDLGNAKVEIEDLEHMLYDN